MPIYEYRCAACGFQKEYLQKMSDALLTDCPECGKASLGKMVTAAGFQLKGSGWYATDFKQGAKPPGGGAGKSGAKNDAKSEGNSGAKTESKAETKSDAGAGGGKPAADTPAKKTESASTGNAPSGAAASTTTTSKTTTSKS
jgi:putative FmdB family regulatory protein